MRFFLTLQASSSIAYWWVMMNELILAEYKRPLSAILTFLCSIFCLSFCLKSKYFKKYLKKYSFSLQTLLQQWAAQNPNAFAASSKRLIEVITHPSHPKVIINYVPDRDSLWFRGAGIKNYCWTVISRNKHDSLLKELRSLWDEIKCC